jgi:DNA-directed RNA polymerase subunit beta
MSPQKTTTVREQKHFSKYREPFVSFPSLIETQLNSFKALLEKGIVEVMKEFTPITDYSGKKFELHFLSFSVGEPKCSELDAKANKVNYEAPIKARVKLISKLGGATKEQEIFMADIPIMTGHGTFVINGVERVIVPQLARSAGVFFTENELKGKRLFGAKIIPSRGVWIEMETDTDGILYVRIDKKRKFPITSLLRVLGITDAEMLKLFTKEHEQKSIALALAKDSAKTVMESYVEVYKRLRDGDLATADNAKEFIDGTVFGPDRYDISSVGRFRINQQFGGGTDEKDLKVRTLTKEDLVNIVKYVFELNITPGAKIEDIDHLGRRRVKYVGELLEQKIRTGMMQIKRNIQDRMSTVDLATALPIQIINQRPLQARIKEFFTTNQLSQFMRQDNILDEVEHLRTLSALGPGGLTRERAGAEVRDVHTSHYGRVCPINTPEGPNIGLILHLSTYARVNEFGIIETPYVKVEKGRITGKIEYLNALEEEERVIAHAGLRYDKDGKITDAIVEARIKTQPGLISKDEVDYVDVAPNQAFSIATSMVPFLEHNNANRALMGSNMQRQAVPCVAPEAPLVATGMEGFASRDSGRLVVSESDGEVTHADSKKVIVKDSKDKIHRYNLVNFSRTNQFSAHHQRPSVSVGQKVKKGQVLADTSTSVNGQIALGQNILVGFLSWSGHNYEDAIVISERLVKNSVFTSIYIEEFVCVVRDTKLGPEITTRDIPNVGELKLKDLDEDGIVRMGAEVSEGDILVGKITPKGETELTAEERLLRSIFSEKARDVKDTSMRIDHGKKGRVISVKVFSREEGHSLESGVLKKVIVEVAQLRNISVGDKLAGRHGNKGVISTILPEEDMPYMADGTPIDILLTPLGIPSRMNLGQIFEMHLGLAANSLGYQAIVPPFAGATAEEIKEELVKAGWPETGRVTLYDGRNGMAFGQDIAVGYMYMLKLHHMVEDKIHMRSIGPYSLITQQPLGGRAQGGGQRFGEMEVWALQGYGAAYTLREMITVKSDDIMGRSQTFDSIIKGEKLKAPNAPASLGVMLNYLRGLSLDVTLNVENDGRKEKLTKESE